MTPLKLIAICFNVSRGTSGHVLKILFSRMFHVKQFVNLDDILQVRILFRGENGCEEISKGES